jgi:DNA-binding response OmpR family regulator
MSVEGEAMSPSAQEAFTGRRVLLAEDTMFVADEIEHMLQQFGFEVVGPFPRLKAVLGAATSESLDLALLDVNLNDESVFPAAEALLERSVPFIFLTGYDAKSLPEEFRSFPRLTKPFGEGELRTIIQEVLGSPAGGPGR